MLSETSKGTGLAKSSGTVENSFPMLHVSVNSDFNHMVSTITEQALIFKQTNELLSFDLGRMVPHIQSPAAKSSGTVSVLFNCRVSFG